MGFRLLKSHAGSPAHSPGQSLVMFFDERHSPVRRRQVKISQVFGRFRVGVFKPVLLVATRRKTRSFVKDKSVL